jgi:hypothetical protein
MPCFMLKNTTTEHVEAWLVATLRGYNDDRMPGRGGEIERIDPDGDHPYVLYWVDVVIPRSRDGTCYPMALEARMLQIGPDTVRLELNADQVAQPWLERLVTDMENDFELQPDRPARNGEQPDRPARNGEQPDRPAKGGAPRLEDRIDWEDKVVAVRRIDAEVAKGKVVKVACENEGIPYSTYRYVKKRIAEGGASKY